MKVTLETLRNFGACISGYNKVVCAMQGRDYFEETSSREYRYLAGEGEVTLESILYSNDLDDALWALRCVEGAWEDIQGYADWCMTLIDAEHVSSYSLAHLHLLRSKVAAGTLGIDILAIRVQILNYRRFKTSTVLDEQKAMFVKMCRGEAPWQK